jgi:hypothetical protein
VSRIAAAPTTDTAPSNRERRESEVDQILRIVVMALFPTMFLLCEKSNDLNYPYFGQIVVDLHQAGAKAAKVNGVYEQFWDCLRARRNARPRLIRPIRGYRMAPSIFAYMPLRADAVAGPHSRRS